MFILLIKTNIRFKWHYLVKVSAILFTAPPTNRYNNDTVQPSTVMNTSVMNNALVNCSVVNNVFITVSS